MNIAIAPTHVAATDDRIRALLELIITKSPQTGRNIYRTGWSDSRVGSTLSVPIGTVERVRVELYGKAKSHRRTIAPLNEQQGAVVDDILRSVPNRPPGIIKTPAYEDLQEALALAKHATENVAYLQRVAKKHRSEINNMAGANGKIDEINSRVERLEAALPALERLVNVAGESVARLISNLGGL